MKYPVRIFLSENLEELPGSGGPFGIELFQDKVDINSREAIEDAVEVVYGKAVKIGTRSCEFAVSAGRQLIAKGDIVKGPGDQILIFTKLVPGAQKL